MHHGTLNRTSVQTWTRLRMLRLHMLNFLVSRGTNSSFRRPLNKDTWHLPRCCWYHSPPLRHSQFPDDGAITHLCAHDKSSDGSGISCNAQSGRRMLVLSLQEVPDQRGQESRMDNDLVKGQVEMEGKVILPSRMSS